MNLSTRSRAADGEPHKKGAAPQRDPNGLDTMNNTAPTPMGQPQLAFIREGFVKMTPAQANMIIKWCRYERQRDETRAKGHIATLAEYMRRGQWLDKSQLDFARLDGRLILVNGHHRMRAQGEAGIDILWGVAIHDCASDTELRSLYYRFDTTLRKRSVANIVDGIGMYEDLGLRKRFATNFWRAGNVIARDMRITNNPTAAQKLPDEIMEVVAEYEKEAQWFGAKIQKAPLFIQGRLQTASVLSVALVTIKYAPVEAREFWGGLCDDDGLRKGDPRKTLLADLASRKGGTGLQSGLMISVAKAWNAWLEGRDLKIIKVTGHAVEIKGTPYMVRT